MRKIFTFIIFMYSVSALAQNITKLFYFTKETEDRSYVGIKDENGKVIIPAEIWNVRGFEDGEIITSNLLSLDGCPKNIEREKNSWGCVFDREGNYLYQTFFYDNGPDYRVEGYQRIVKNGKVGFANRNGEIVIPPQFDFVTPFNYGYAQYCEGCHWERVDEEHKIVVGGQWGVINFRGEKVLPLKEKSKAEDIEIEGKYYSYPFSHSGKEQKILDFFNNQMKLLAEIEYVNFYHQLSTEEKIQYFEIVERPSKYFPFYVIYPYDYRKYHGGLGDVFLVSFDGEQFYYTDSFGEKTPFKEWLEQEIQEARDYQKRTKDNPNKFTH